MRVLGIDLGTSFIKGAVLDLDALTIRHIERMPFPEPVKTQNPAFREFDPRRIEAITRALLENLLRHAPDAQDVVMCSQLHGLVLTDETGLPKSNFINWQDERALTPMNSGDRTYFDEINARLTPDERRSIGNEARPGVPLCFLFSLIQNNALPPASLIAASLSNFIIANLCGSEPKSDITNAFAHGAFNLETGSWHRGVINKLGLDAVRWPEIVRQGSRLGSARIGSGNLTFFAPVGDYQCAQVGSFLKEGELSINVSTGSGVAMLGEKLEFGDFQTRPFFDNRMLRTITHIPGGRALNALIKMLGEMSEAQGHKIENTWEYVLAEASRVKKTDVRVDPSFYFSATGDRGAIFNLYESNMTVGHLFHATFEAMADNYARCALKVAPETDRTRIVFSGGVALKAELLRRLICERLGTAHRIVATEEDTLLGLLGLGIAFTKRTESVNEAVDYLQQNYHPQS